MHIRMLRTNRLEYVCVCVCVCVLIGEFTHTDGMLATALRLVGFRIILSRVLTMSAKRGRTLRSFCQQSSINWCRVLGQSMGGGRR